ncbi:MAG TPA: recombinase family protein [Chloroflexota bacterium]|nr:recombinase family protein [Chloroflexota bacterium]
MQIVSYLRVSTAKQGLSGLGLEAQRAAVAQFTAAGRHTLISEFLEVESGRKSDRPQLTAALASCRLHRATLVIAKLDRLARNVAFIANLMDGGVEFVACDMPHANRLTLHLLAAIAEHEREMISQRTKAALQAAKARGVRLGNPNGATALLEGCRAAAERSAGVRRARAVQQAAAVAPTLAELSASGLSSRQMAVALNGRGVPSPSGRSWYSEQVRRTRCQLEARDVS